MKTAMSVAQWLVRIVGLAMLVLGVLFWAGTARNLVGIHMLLGLILVLILWALAALAARAGVHWGRIALAIVWGFIVPALGVLQTQLLPGDFHWVIQAIHLLVGIALLGQADALATAVRARSAQAEPQAGGEVQAQRG